MTEMYYTGIEMCFLGYKEVGLYFIDVIFYI